MAPRDLLDPDHEHPPAGPKTRYPARSPEPGHDRRAVVLACILALGDLLAFGSVVAALTVLDVVSFDMRTFIVTALALPIVFCFGGLYRRGVADGDELGLIVVAVGILCLCLAASNVAVVTLVLLWVFGSAVLLVMRAWLRGLPIAARLGARHLVLVGLGADRQALAYERRGARAGSVHVLRGASLGALAALPDRRFERWVEQVANRHGLPRNQLEILVVPHVREAPAARVVIRRLRALGQPFAMSMPQASGISAEIEVDRVVGADDLFLRVRPRRPGTGQRAAKRALDVVIAGIGVLLIAPLLAMIAIALWREGGPVLFRQTRVGHARRRFSCFKFRTMRPDAEDRLKILLECNPEAREEWTRHQKLAADPRVTPLGRLLRASSLDELPQLFNILRGDMSLVGPRPIVAPEVAGYVADKGYYESPAFTDYARCTPGLTGLWQVSGRHETSHTERVRLDRWYAANQSVWLDLAIMLKTVRVVLLGTGR